MGGLEALGLGLAAFAAGAVNAVAGGGSLISFPALIAAGYGAKSANVTSTVALWPGSVGGSIAYRAELGSQRERIKVLGAIAILGAIVGSILLLVSPPGVFKAIVPWLIFFACFLLLVQPRLSAWVRAHRPRSAEVKHPAELLGGQFVASIYGAYFGAGLGIVTLAILGIFLPDDLQKLNALKGLLRADHQRHRHDHLRHFRTGGLVGGAADGGVQLGRRLPGRAHRPEVRSARAPRGRADRRVRGRVQAHLVLNWTRPSR